MADKHEDKKSMAEKPAVTLPGTVEKIIPSVGPGEPEKAQIAVEGADPLYREIRVENKLQDAVGNPVGMKKGAEVEITIETEPKNTTPKKPTEPKAPRVQDRSKDRGAA